MTTFIPNLQEATILPPIYAAGTIPPDMNSEGKQAIRKILTTSQPLDAEQVAEYCEAIKLCNVLRLSILARALIDGLAENPCELAVLVPGSDGRLEKGPFLDDDKYSPIELILLTSFEQVAKRAQAAVLELSNSKRVPPIDNRVEIKLQDDQNYLSGYNGDKRHSWPDRILSAHQVFGATSLHSEAAVRVSVEWKDHHIRESVKNYYKQFVRACETGESRGKRHFCLETGEIFYDQDKYIRGLKYGPIRALQIFLTMYELKKGDVGTIVPNTSEKLAHFFPEEKEVIVAYQTALRIYHWQQHQAKLGKNAHVSLQPEELRHIVSTIKNFIISQAD